MISVICAEIKNYFLKDYIDPSQYIYHDTYTIENGVITPLDFIKPGQYFRIVGSDLNEGVYKNTAEGLSELRDEVFSGSVWAMSVPPAFEKLVDNITAWQEKHGGADSRNMSPFTSESFGGYSYSKSGGASGGTAVTWDVQYAKALKPYRRISVL